MTAWPARLVPLDDEQPTTLEEAARDELMLLWSDLNAAIEQAHRGGWSMRCEYLASRIVALTRHVGATPWEQIDVKLVRCGAYERIHQEAGLEYPPIDWDGVAEHERHLAQEYERAMRR